MQWLLPATVANNCHNQWQLYRFTSSHCQKPTLTITTCGDCKCAWKPGFSLKWMRQISGHFSTINPRNHDIFQYRVWSASSCTTANELWILNCLCPWQMLKQRLVSQLYTNYITKKYLINGLLFSGPHSKISWLFFSTYVIIRDISGLQKSNDEFRTFQDLWKPLKTNRHHANKSSRRAE